MTGGVCRCDRQSRLKTRCRGSFIAAAAVIASSPVLTGPEITPTADLDTGEEAGRGKDRTTGVMPRVMTKYTSIEMIQNRPCDQNLLRPFRQLWRNALKVQSIRKTL